MDGTETATEGGRIASLDSVITLTHVTMYKNSSGSGAGDGFHADSASTAHIINSIIYGGPDACNATVAKEVSNIIGSGNCSSKPITDDPLLGDLTGSPAYFPLLPGSPAIDTGFTADCLEVDQTGASRAGKGSTCDKGAYEHWVEPRPSPQPPRNNILSFGDGIVGNQIYMVGESINVTLAEATGGNGELTFSISPTLPEGLSFDPETRKIEDVPKNEQEETEYTYTVEDTNGDTAQLTFSITIQEVEDGGGGCSIANADQTFDLLTALATLFIVYVIVYRRIKK